MVQDIRDKGPCFEKNPIGFAERSVQPAGTLPWISPQSQKRGAANATAEYSRFFRLV